MRLDDILGKENLEKLRSKLTEEKVELGDVDDDYGDSLSPELISKLIKQPYSFNINEDGELVVTVDDEVYCLDPKRNRPFELAEAESKLLKVLPELTWDVYCGGIKRKQQESVAAFKVIVINSSLKNAYDEEINKILSDYDFEHLRPINSDGMTFSDLLTIIEQDVGSVGKFVLSCCSIAIVSKKQKGGKEYIGILPETDVEWLDSLKSDINIIESSTSKLLISEPSKRKRLGFIESKDQEISKLVAERIDNDARRDIIFKISRLTSDDLPEPTKVRIRKAVRKSCDELLSEGVITNYDSYKLITQKVSRRVVRFALKSYKQHKYSQLMSADDKELSKILEKQ